MISPSLSINESGHLAIGGMDVPTLAKKYGTPLYIMDEDNIRSICREYNSAMKKHYGDNFMVAYASKAFSAKYMYKILNSENMAIDVVSGGEMYTALKAGFPANRMYFHGNNKTDAELEMALDAGIRRFVVDNREELTRLSCMAKEKNVQADISFRIKPGIDAHTHDFIMTGQIDSKFGVALQNGEAMQIVKEALELENINLAGLHCHIGSQIFENRPFKEAACVMMQFIKAIKEETGHEIGELNLGGGFGIKYTENDDPEPIDKTVKNFTDAVKEAAEETGTALPFLVIEPGRSIVATSGITVYTVGSVKEIKDVRTYVSVDGGMADNPRYALYQAEYTAVLPEKMNEKPTEKVTVAGRCCESGDLIGKDMLIPTVKAGDLLAILSTGAYNYSMASNYNRLPRPPVIMVSEGDDKMIVRRETYEDIIKNDLD